METTLLLIDSLVNFNEREIDKRVVSQFSTVIEICDRKFSSSKLYIPLKCTRYIKSTTRKVQREKHKV